MKQKFIILLLLLLVANLFSTIISQQYNFENPSITKLNNWDFINFENTKLTGEIGSPTLPYQAISLLLPIGHSAKSIKIIFSEEVVLTGKYNLYPQQAPRPISEGESGEFSYNNKIYSQDINYPNNKHKIKTSFKNGYPISMTTFTPVVYNPQHKSVKYYKKAIVEITTDFDEKAEKAKAFLQSNDRIKKQIKGMVDNPELFQNNLSPNSSFSRYDEYEVMIITDSTFTDEFTNLTDFYLTKGMRASIFSVQDIINDNFGIDVQEKIRNAIIVEYQISSIQYVVLAGDVPEVPYRGFYCYVESGSGYESNNIPADIYYSALDGSWNNDNDENWGEIGEDDLLQEIAVGRIPFSNSEELASVIHKTISYQDSPVVGELENPLMVGEVLWNDPLTFGADYLDLLIGFHDDNGYETFGIPEDYNISTLFDRDLNYWSAQELVDAINLGTSFIHHSGHSNATYNMRLQNSDITNENFYSLNGIDHNYTLEYTHGCICGAFDIDDCIAERMLNIDNFLVAGIFNSRYGWFNEGQTEGPSHHLHREFVDAIYGDDIVNIGFSHLSSKTDTAPWLTADDQYEPGAIRWCFYDANLIGDPTLAIWSSEPKEIVVTYDEQVPLDCNGLEYNVTYNGEALSGVTITLLNENVFLKKGITDDSGNTLINFDESFSEPTTLDIYVSGNNIITQYYVVDIGTTSNDEDLNLETELFSAYPNPFYMTADRGTEVTISFSLADISENVELKIYNSKGQFIKSLINEKFLAGNHSTSWDATDYRNIKVSSGIYFYKLSSNEKNIIKKIMLLK